MAHSFLSLPLIPLAGFSSLIGFAFVVGACVGSFVHATALRLNRGEGILASSRCRDCNKNLAWYMNLPLIGWLSSWGRCRYCGERFSPRYLFVEIFMGLIAAILIGAYSLLMASILFLAIMLITICALTDLEKMLLHLPILLLLGGIGFGLSFFSFWMITPINAILGAAVPLLVMLSANTIYKFVRGQNGFGSGDFWLIAAVGFWLGPALSLMLLFMATAIGALVGILLLSLTSASSQTPLPFGVFIAVVFICFPLINILVMMDA